MFNDRPAPPNSPILYTSWAQYPVRKFSYSLAASIDGCGEKALNERFLGYGPKIEPAAFKFGIACEESIVEFYRLGTHPEENFITRWKKWEKIPLQYTNHDDGWRNLFEVGKALMRLFRADSENYPIVNPEFGVPLPRDENQTWYNGTQLEYIADVISHPKDGDMLIDFKTVGQDPVPKDGQEGYAALDPQLLTGALVSGIRRVGFIFLVKTRQPKIRFVSGEVTDKQLAGVDGWLREQYTKLIEKRLYMRMGVRFPNNSCLSCDFLPKCLGKSNWKENLRQKESKEVSGLMGGLDDIE